MPIRVRILLLALVTVLGVGSALFIQFQMIGAEVETLEHRVDIIDRARLTSRFVHALQKERGLSAGFLMDPDAGCLGDLLAQRRRTDQILTTLKMGKTHPLLASEWLTGFRQDLDKVRKQVDTGNIGWQAVRNAYTGAITHALDAISIEFLEGGEAGHGRMLMAITSLALARENLGLIRAAIFRICLQNRQHPDELADVMQYFGSFNEHLRAFTRDITGPERNAFLSQVFTEVHVSVTHQIQALLGGKTDPPQRGDSRVWWDEVTGVIDGMKAVEDRAYDNLEARLDQETEAKRARLVHYAVIATVLVAVTLVLTASTILRMLKAMSVLLTTLGQVMADQDFSRRISVVRPGDELGRICQSFNQLLGFTDTLIKEKVLLANTDLLTGLLNRRSLLEGAELELARTRRYGNKLGIILCDIDHFKAVNDTHGHAVGDDVLKRFAKLLQSQVRQSDLVGRWGGEEFVVLVLQADSVDLAALAEKLRRAVEKADLSNVGTITCSIGVADSRPHDDFDSLLKRADDALYEAKSQGRNRVVVSA